MVSGGVLQWGRAVEGAETMIAETSPSAPEQLQWGRAVEGAETTFPVRREGAFFRGFNGAAPLKARKREERVEERAARAGLQWGRAVEGAETSSDPGRGDLQRLASMGPRR